LKKPERYNDIPPAGPLEYLCGEPPLTEADNDIQFVYDLERDLASELRRVIGEVKQALTEPFPPMATSRLRRLDGTLRIIWERLGEHIKWERDGSIIWPPPSGD
jgi:hypothetical protein